MRFWAMKERTTTKTRGEGNKESLSINVANIFCTRIDKNLPFWASKIYKNKK